MEHLAHKAFHPLSRLSDLLACVDETKPSAVRSFLDLDGRRGHRNCVGRDDAKFDGIPETC